MEILSVLPEPTGIIDSGNGWHCYWLLNQVQPITNMADLVTLEKASKEFQYRAINHAQFLGYHVDYTGNLDRILRLPSTTNTKTSNAIRVCPIYTNGPRYNSILDLVDVCVPGSPISVPTPGPNTDSDGRSSGKRTSQDPGPDQNLAKAQTLEHIRHALENLSNPESKHLLDPVLKGLSFAPAGSRDATLQRIASVIAYVASDRDPRELATEILGASLSTFEPDDVGKYTQEDRIEWATEKISRAQADARIQRAREAEENQKILTSLLATARSAPRRDQRLGPAPQGPYTDQEMQAFASQQGTTPPNFQHRWIIQKGQQYYIYVNGDYQKPIDNSEFKNSFTRDLSPAANATPPIISLETISSKGEPRRKTPEEILRDYCSVARTHVTRLDLGYSYYDEDTQTFNEASCPIRPLQAQHNPQIETWLNLLGGSKAPLLLDWIATITNLQHQTSALYLQGPPGIGKTLISHGLARLWHSGGPTELMRVIGDWTSDMAKCPLLVADEEIPQTFRGHKTSAQLRALIGNSARTLTRKFAHNSDLVGSIRMILSANNAEMLVFDETLSQDDLEAIAGRFLHVEGSAQASQYLKSISTQGWVSDDLIAKHALYLRDTRKVKTGSRFLVEGSAKDISKQIATRGSVAGRVTEWLVRYLCEHPTSKLAAKQTNPQQKQEVLVGNGHYLVNTNAIVGFWEQWSKAKVTPTTPQVGQALRNLSKQQVRIGPRRYFDIDIEAISQWAEANLIGDKEQIQERINIESDEIPIITPLC